MNEDELRAAMRARDHDAPDARDFHPVVRRDPRVPAAVGAVAIVGTAAAIAVTLSSNSSTPVAGPRPSDMTSAQVTITTGSNVPSSAHGCPAQYGPNKNIFGWVPPGAARRAPRSALVPNNRPDAVVVCGYLGGRSALTGASSLTGDLSAVTDDLRQARSYRRSDSACLDYFASTDSDNYLIKLTFAGRVVWVSAPGNHCDTSTNGVYKAGVNLRADAAQAYRYGTWVTDPSLRHLCSPSAPNPRGTRLLPPNPRTLTICESVQPAGGDVRVYRYANPGNDAIQTYNYLVKHGPTHAQCKEDGRYLGPVSTLTVRFGYRDGSQAVIRVTYMNCARGPGEVTLSGQRGAEVYAAYTFFWIDRV